MKHTAGRWDPKEENIYFIASGIDTLLRGGASNHNLLVAVNEVGTGDVEQIETWIDDDKHVFIDSGVFNITNEHARKHGVSMDTALQLAPDEIDGFDALFKKYTNLIDRVGDQCWGYIEIDQGGCENKIKTRNRLEKLGYRPIPVYHPLNDGWDYFDLLAQNYDRICFGNIVQADRVTRKRLIATAWERRRKYPHLWIHILGMTPNETLNAFPVNSCDSSTWLNLVRWPTAVKGQAGLKPVSEQSKHLTYDMTTDPDSPTGHWKARQLGGYKAHHLCRTWRRVQADYRNEVGCDTGSFT